MYKEAWGLKRICPMCSKQYYDLGRMELECPECGKEIEVTRVFYSPPTYPRNAIRLGREGYVLIEFDVDTDGAVLDPYVIESEPTGVFERAGIKAVRKWLYSPPSYNGVSVKVNDVRARVIFNLE